jgi:hypothetical protein
MNLNGVPNLNMSTTIQSMADQLKIHTKLQNFFNVGGIDGQPMLRLAQNVNEMLLVRRMAWKFNRVDLGSNNPAVNPHFFISQQGFQDFKHAGASCFTLINSTTPGGQLPAGGAGVDLNPGVYQNGNAKVSYGTFNGGNSYGPSGAWQTAGIIFNPANGTLTVQFLDPHPFLPGNIGTSIFLIQGVMNPAYNSTFVYNQLTQLSGWVNGYNLVSIPDQFHIVLQGNGGQQNTLASISASGGITTITLGTTNPVPVYPPNNFNGQYSAANTSGAGLTAGDIMTFGSVANNPGLDGKIVTLLTATATQVTFKTPTGVTIVPGSDTGDIFAAPSGAPGIFNLGWVQSAAVLDINNPSFPLPVAPIDAVHRISPEYTSTGDNVSLSCEIDYGCGVVKFRLSQPVSTYPFAYTVVYQARAPKFTSGQSVFQWPDDLSWVLFEMCLWQGMRFAYGISATETQAQMQIAALAVQNALESEDREANDMSMTPEWNIMR